MADQDAQISIKERLLKERHALLDLSARNRLLNTPLRTRNNRAIEIVDEKSAEVYRLLTAGKALGFLPGTTLSDEEKAELDPDDDITGGIPQPEDDSVDERGIAARHADLHLQTRLTSEGLQKRLLDIWYEAYTLEQDQGVNILYLALGLLKWFDSDSSDIARHAPLILLPVKLERSSASARFKLKWRDEPASPNLTLQEKVKAEFGLIIENFNNEDEVDLQAYCDAAAATISSKSRWEILPDAMILGFFSFSKFLMYRDLDPENWPQSTAIDTHPLVRAILHEGFPEHPPIINDDTKVDHVITPLNRNHVVDADSSQSIAIEEVVRGRHMVIKGPPGTGKSQTITNIIAAAVAKGRKILFVAEKMAALEVVYRRLQHNGLGALTLELHSNKANKRVLLEELRNTRDAQLRTLNPDHTIIDKLDEYTKQINTFAERLHCPLNPCGFSPQQILGRLSHPGFKQADKLYTLYGVETWDQAQVENRRTLIDEISQLVKKIEPVDQSLWRGVNRKSMDPIERSTLEQEINETQGVLTRLFELSEQAHTILSIEVPSTMSDLLHNIKLLSITEIPQDMDRSVIHSTLWSTPGTNKIKQVIDAGRHYTAAWTLAAKKFTDTGMNANYDELRQSVVTKGSHLLRFFDSNYRAQIALLKSYLKSKLPSSKTERIKIIDEVISAQKALANFLKLEHIGAVFGKAWKGTHSSWPSLEQFLEWRQQYDAVPQAVWDRLAHTEELAQAQQIHKELSKDLNTFKTKLQELFSNLCLDLSLAFSTTATDQIPLELINERLTQWRSDTESINHYITFAQKANTLPGLGLKELFDELHAGHLNSNTITNAFEQAYTNALRMMLFEAWPELKEFDGEIHNETISKFRHLDLQRISLAKEQIVTHHAEGKPHGMAGIGPLGVLNAEIAKKRGHLPIRTLLDKAGPAIQQLKPVFMMSPLSVAQFLKPGGMQFDLLVMDEASQIEPVDALGSIARVDQLVVVGDERQLPPTAFFKKLAGEGDQEDENDEITIAAKDAESILELCLAKGVPYRMLNWHYRSKHQSLIAVSNREFYENKLFIVPSPYDIVAGMGLKFNLLKDAPYDRGGTRTNPVEARVVAQAVIQHARTHPDQSLGVATFSVAQRQAILKELELLRRANPDTEEYFVNSKAEPFFVKNLENIQGDERDIIFISVGYGKNEQGYFAHSFGPLNSDGGERRLNVLISRAKLRCEVFANFTGADIDLERVRARARGVIAFKLFLTFAEHGHFGLGESVDSEFDSEFEAHVSDKLSALGYDVKRQIGASGFRVDLAISDPEHPGRFILGIECDGAQYHSSRSARDRDRLRQQVLEAHGWIIHRIWSIDWFLRPQHELKKIENAIAHAKSIWQDRDETLVHSARAVPLSFESSGSTKEPAITAVLGEHKTNSDNIPVYYQEADFKVNTRFALHEAPISEIISHVVRIVELEGPIHSDEIVVRLRTLWGLARAGARIKSIVERAIHAAEQQGHIHGQVFFNIPNRPARIRDRSLVSSQSLRKPEMLPPEELDAAVLQLIDTNFGAAIDDLIPSTAKLFGYANTSSLLRTAINERIQQLITDKLIEEKSGLLVRVKK